ncbi:hypothetical protein [Edaphobacter aggregans]|uniref:hypothetical protein n=1 Tax=Edaphobacter aggregans TaxID=570835 RepID=UPI000555BBB6|nr:hypothetical protein [Edaphobacter aggregans]
MTRTSSHAFLRAMRLIHLYLGVFTAPALIFFAFTGALQTFSLHETTKGSSYKPPAWAVTLGQIHKKQTPVVPVRKQPPAGSPAGPAAPGREGAGSGASAAGQGSGGGMLQRVHHPLPLKIFFLVVSVSLFLSTLTGIYMSYKYLRDRRMVTAMLVLGMVIPVALLFV